MFDVQTKTTKVLLVSPQLAVDDVTECQVTFYMSGNATYDRNIIVGMVDDVTNEAAAWASFVPVDTFIIKSAAWIKQTAKFNVASATGKKRIAFTTSYDLSTAAFWGDKTRTVKIDDIDLELIPTCARPDGITVTDVTDKTATLKIQAGESSAADWNLEYGPKGFVLGTGTVEHFTGKSEGTISGLTPETKYDVYLTAVCGAADKSRVVGPFNVTSTPEILTVGSSIVFDFEDEADNAKWFFKNKNQKNQWHIGSAYSKGEGGKALYLSDNGGENAHYDNKTKSVVWVYRYITLQQGMYKFSYDWNCVGAYSDWMGIMLTPATSSFSEDAAAISFADGSRALLYSVNDHDGPYFSLLPDGMNKLSEMNGWQKGGYSYDVDVEMAGTYMLAIMWTNNGDGRSKQQEPSAVIDNITIEYTSCPFVSGITATDVTSDGCTLAWDAVDGAAGYEVAVLDTANVLPGSAEAAGHVKFTDTPSAVSTKITSLAPSTQHYMYVRAKCSADSYGLWSNAVALKTACALFEVGDVFSFEDGEYVPDNNSSIKVPECFVSGHSNASASYNSYWPKVQKSTATYIYSRSGETSVYFNGAANNYFGGYIVVPEIRGDIDTMQLTFYMRPIYHYVMSSTGEIQYNKSNLNYARSARTLTVGIMTDPANPATFEKITDCVYPYTDQNLPETDPYNDNFWRKFTVKFDSYQGNGRYIAIKCDMYDAVENKLYIDDISVESSRDCVTPFDLKVDSIGDVAARLSFSHGDGNTWEVLVSSAQEMTDTVFIDTVHSNVVELQNLIADADMYVAVRQLCGLKQSDWSYVEKFHTSYSIKFFEEFKNRTRVPVDWRLSAMAPVENLDDFFSGKFSFPETEPDWTYTRKDGWKFNEGTGLTGAHMTCEASQSCGYWLVMPDVHINAYGHTHFTFNAALTKHQSDWPLDIAELNDTNATFAVCISEDAGRTWLKDNSVIWDNNGGDLNFDAISAAGELIRIDLSEYSGKTVKIAFLCRYTRKETAVDFHIDNVRINNFYQDNRTGNICETQDYFENGFEILAKDIQVGVENIYNRSVYVAANEPDTIVTLTLACSPIKENAIEATICAGDTYAENGFAHTDAGVYKRKIGSETACDSVAILTLSVIDIPHTIEYDTICQGQKVVWHGKEYSRTGMYNDTLQMNNSCKCDSIVSLALYVTGALTGSDEVKICYGSEYIFGGKVLTESGIYLDTVTTDKGCDSIISVTLTVLPELKSRIDTAICLGENYTDETFVSIDRTGGYKITVESADKCDSTVTLNLLVVDPYNVVVIKDTIERSDLPYDFYGKVYGMDTPDGVYNDTVVVKTANCEGKVALVLYLNATGGTGVENIESVQELIITPNPVRVHERVTVHLDLTADQRNGLTVQVYSNTGTLVRQSISEYGPIVIDGFSAAGLYIVRITVGTGNVYVGKVLVR